MLKDFKAMTQIILTLYPEKPRQFWHFHVLKG